MRENAWKGAAFSCAHVWLMYSIYTAIQSKHLFATLVQKVHSTGKTIQIEQAAQLTPGLSSSGIKYAKPEKAL